MILHTPAGGLSVLVRKGDAAVTQNSQINKQNDMRNCQDPAEQATAEHTAGKKRRMVKALSFQNCQG